MNVLIGAEILSAGLLICGGTSVIFILRGDDDISDRLHSRKPTVEEATRRIGYVLSMLFTTIFGGCVSAILFKILVILPYHVTNNRVMTRNENDLLIAVSMFVFFVLLRSAQNLIRRFQGRKPRPLVDVETLRH